MSDYIEPRELHELVERDETPTVVDVRSPEEYAAGHLPGARNRPADEIPNRLADIPRDRPVVVY